MRKDWLLASSGTCSLFLVFFPPPPLQNPESVPWIQEVNAKRFMRRRHQFSLLTCFLLFMGISGPAASTLPSLKSFPGFPFLFSVFCSLLLRTLFSDIYLFVANFQLWVLRCLRSSFCLGSSNARSVQYQFSAPLFFRVTSRDGYSPIHSEAERESGKTPTVAAVE